MKPAVKRSSRAPAAKVRNRITIRGVEPSEHVFSLTRMQRECFPKDAFKFLQAGYWVMAFVNRIHPIGFALIVQEDDRVGIVERVGVMPTYRGRRLMLRILKSCEFQARKLGLRQLIATTFNNPAATNCFMYAGWQNYEPEEYFAGTGSQYWFKDL